ncbi:hypothetical protein [Halopseudomonas maritima]|uniref:hypothetical protein n=1 Tax=Halopseudomonas maritima TaxID=2918528 RepID=UPI001EEC11F7|nr:hypothetical protein [Halopseudomonas maritima]UJJ32965.1 hypothetical protein HV822_07420 [Halopseudomonas maritima]
MNPRYSAWLLPGVVAMGLCVASLLASAQSELAAQTIAGIPVAPFADIFSRF